MCLLSLPEFSVHVCVGGAFRVPHVLPQHPRHNHDALSQMLLLVHWSILAYTGLVKILKKHYKRTGLRVRAPHLDNLLSQPFCSVEVRFWLTLEFCKCQFPPFFCAQSGDQLYRNNMHCCGPCCAHPALFTSAYQLVLAWGQIMSELLRKAEQSVDSLAARLRAAGGNGRPDGGEPARPGLPAALSGSCLARTPPADAMEALINATRSSVEQVAGAARGEQPAFLETLAAPSWEAFTCPS